MKALTLALLIVGCASIPAFRNVTAYGQRPVEPSAIHYGTWLTVVQCAGQQRDFEGVQWFVADSLMTSEGERVWGIWTPERKIVLDIGLWFFPGLIAHELMHDIYRGEIPQEIEMRCTPSVHRGTLERVLHR